MTSILAKGAVAAAALFLFHGAALAGQQDFTILNKTGYALKHIYVSESDNQKWDEDVLGRDVLDDGEEFELSFDTAEKTCKWDMKVIYDDGESAVWQNLNLCKIAKLTLRWNKNTGVTSASVE
ncbi:hypothetical protein FBZ82_11560 [Azospirillum brasilense]|uniref:Argininosuccinate lyase n=1 Tax=Azospirillum brasilense TaxID=192 RepID=A0A560AP90_AZOBR|nr:hypothetical protein [Azospirillum brasilense]MBK3733518.1 hypothetical protein [Azospirillum brasilense]TWA62168.1 hypothetical protein FBZ82_11560 [Azospirillum brasilense]TWA78637.1 hypothetical protein FBZ83_112138 [Azospirillum brasilense]